MALRTSAAELTTTSSRDDAAELAATTSSSRDDAEAAAAKATLDLLRVADAINADGDALGFEDVVDHLVADAHSATAAVVVAAIVGRLD